MEENFNMRRIHAGYVVEFRNGERALAMRYDNGGAGDNLVFVNHDTDRIYGISKFWDGTTLLRTREPLRLVNRADLDIMAVYGYVRNLGHGLYPGRFGLDLKSTETRMREELWHRKEESVKMTLAQVCEKLGYDVEIVKEGMEDAE